MNSFTSLKRATVSAVLALGLSACVTRPEMMPNSKFQLVAAEMQIVKERVAYNLREPKSAEFLPKMFGNKTAAGDIVVCGAVNSRNQFGGMTDYVPFIGGWRAGQTAHEFRVGAIGGYAESVQVISKTCQDFGLY